MTPTDLTDAELAIAAARAGADAVRRRYRSPLTRFAKSEIDFATEADLESERAIKATVAAARPEDAFVGEEEGLSGSADAARTWLVDPLCGTLNFAAATPVVGVNVALRSDGLATAAAVAAPFGGDVLWTDGSGAFRRDESGDRPIAPSALSRLVDVDFDWHLDWARRVVASPDLLPRFGLRVSSSSLALTWTATGQRAAYLHGGFPPDSVHFAAPLALCRAAGCVVTGLDGGEPGVGGLIVAADQDTHAALLTAVGG